MFDKIETPRELFTHKLGAALTMERTVLDMLGELEEAARGQELKQQRVVLRQCRKSVQVPWGRPAHV